MKKQAKSAKDDDEEEVDEDKNGSEVSEGSR